MPTPESERIYISAPLNKFRNTQITWKPPPTFDKYSHVKDKVNAPSKNKETRST